LTIQGPRWYDVVKRFGTPDLGDKPFEIIRLGSTLCVYQEVSEFLAYQILQINCGKMILGLRSD